MAMFMIPGKITNGISKLSDCFQYVAQRRMYSIAGPNGLYNVTFAIAWT